jgi:hypothetical protein
MANGWTPERRARQSELILRWKPWEKSTGPKSSDGKTKVSQIGRGRTSAFVNVQQIPGKRDGPLYIITTESSLASLLQPFLEARIGGHCPYVEGSFLVHGEQAERLLG